MSEMPRIPPNCDDFVIKPYDGSAFYRTPSGDLIPLANPEGWRRIIALVAVDLWSHDPEGIKTGGCDDYMRQWRLDTEIEKWQEWDDLENAPEEAGPRERA